MASEIELAAGSVALVIGTLTIEDINWMIGRAAKSTPIKSDSGTLAVVSNSHLSNGPLINHSATERLSKKCAIE